MSAPIRLGAVSMLAPGPEQTLCSRKGEEDIKEGTEWKGAEVGLGLVR